MVAIPINLPDSQAERLKKLADRLEIRVEDLIQLHILEHIEAETLELAETADRVFAKNDELLRRLA